MGSNRPRDTLSDLLDDGSDDQNAKLLTVLVHGVVMIEGTEDLTRDLLMNGYLVSTGPPESNDESENSGNNVDALLEMMADVGIANHMVAWKILRRMSIYTRLPYSRS